MIGEWLGPLDRARFAADDNATADRNAGNDRELQPYALAGAGSSLVGLLGWDTFGRVLGSSLPLDVLTVAGGRLVDVPQPRSAADVQRLMRLGPGVSTVVRASELHDAGLAALAAAFAAALPGQVHIQLYATPAGTHSYGWHYDFEDVFIAQTMGAKDYFFRPNTVARHTRLGEVLDLYPAPLVAPCKMYRRLALDIRGRDAGGGHSRCLARAAGMEAEYGRRGIELTRRARVN